MRNRSFAPIACVGILIASAATIAPASTIGQLAAEVSRARYTDYHVTLESIGMPGTDFDGDGQVLGWRGRWTAGTSTAPVFSESNQDARAWIASQLQGFATASNGLTVRSDNRFQNVIARLPGAAPAAERRTYIVGAHFDHVGNASGTSSTDFPGGDDNASGVAAMLEAARVLTAQAYRHDLVFVAFNAEERGLWGSGDFVNNLTAAERSAVAGMVSLDMVLRPGRNGDPSWAIDLDPHTKNDPTQLAWAERFRAAAHNPDYATGLTVDAIYAPATTNEWGRSDHQPFVLAGMPAFLAIENRSSELSANPYYHTINDASFRAANLVAPGYDYGFATAVTRAVVATFAQEATVVPEPAATAAAAAVLLLACRQARRRDRA